MPTYRITSESDPLAEHRAARGEIVCSETGDRIDRRTTFVSGLSLGLALAEATSSGGEHQGRRVISAEELHPGVSFTDEEITAALTSSAVTPGEPLIDPDVFALYERPLYKEVDFISIVGEVVDALRDSGLVPGLHVSVLDADSDEPYAMVEVRDEARGVYISRGAEVRHLTDDRRARNWDGVLAIARELIAISGDLH